jgi:hypothetical protein
MPPPVRREYSSSQAMSRVGHSGSAAEGTSDRERGNRASQPRRYPAEVKEGVSGLAAPVSN